MKRFDRLSSGKKRHFEEFNQLMGRRSGDDKYEAAYEDIAAFLRGVPGHTTVDLLRLFERILVCFLTGNTDAHLKNFAMFHTADGLRLTPAYDLVAAALYPEHQTLALAVGNAANPGIDKLKPKHFVSLGETYGLDAKQVLRVVSALDSRRAAAVKAVLQAAKRIEAETLGQNLVELMEKRWNGSFASTGQCLSKNQSGDDGN
ncbi:MAG: HipA domain-containing protein [Alphaproteobacteria bacterium]|nr:HipA domain-containing protein [Alphaproteobacteria bacterium]